jgi:hypothetical protein
MQLEAKGNALPLRQLLLTSAMRASSSSISVFSQGPVMAVAGPGHVSCNMTCSVYVLTVERGWKSDVCTLELHTVDWRRGAGAAAAPAPIRAAAASPPRQGSLVIHSQKSFFWPWYLFLFWEGPNLPVSV